MPRQSPPNAIRDAHLSEKGKWHWAEKNIVRPLNRLSRGIPPIETGAEPLGIQKSSAALLPPGVIVSAPLDS